MNVPDEFGGAHIRMRHGPPSIVVQLGGYWVRQGLAFGEFGMLAKAGLVHCGGLVLDNACIFASRCVPASHLCIEQGLSSSGFASRVVSFASHHKFASHFASRLRACSACVWDAGDGWDAKMRNVLAWPCRWGNTISIPV